jgi:hypothetical protein
VKKVRESGAPKWIVKTDKVETLAGINLEEAAEILAAL